jgi:glutamate synthase (NADPH/NADH) small chain
LDFGFSGPENQVLDQIGVETDPRLNTRVEHGKFTLSVPGICAARTKLDGLDS